MADISTWSPVDESNTAAPPDGWPEYMLPSAVNNSARAMMGAVRRLYDQQLSGTLVLPYLPITGGTISGAVTLNGGLTTTNINASGTIYAGSSLSTGGSIGASSGNISGGLTVGSISAGSISAGSVTSSGTVSAGGFTTGGTVSAGNLNGTNSTASTAYIGTSGTLWFYDAGGGQIGIHGALTTTSQITSGAFLCMGQSTLITLDTNYIVPYYGNATGQVGSQPGSSFSAMSSYAYGNPSDAREKTDIASLPDCLDIINAIEPKRFRWRDELKLDRRTQWGFVAQEVGEAMQKAGHEFGGHLDDGEHQGLVYDQLIAIVWKALQELSAQVSAAGT
jgi:hypothetical protein